MSDNDKTTKKTGPKEETLNLEMDWEESMKKALKKKRPKGGWPETKKDEKKGK